MHPILFFGPLQVFSYTFSIIVAVALDSFLLVNVLGKVEGRLKVLWVVLGTSIATFVGARFLHVVWEMPSYYLQHPEEVLTHFEGMVLYGGLFAGAATFFLFLKKWVHPDNRGRAWDLAAIGAALTIGTIRLGCFLNGCCWGKPTKLPWAVRYFDPHTAMPYLGIPVHPVQVYESALAFLLLGFLVFLYREKPAFKGKLIFVFCLIYGPLRFLLEFFRGDSFRGVDLVLGMSTSQILSLVLIGFGAVQLKKVNRHFATTCLLLFVLFNLTACLPKPPSESVIATKEMLSEEIELNRIASQKPSPI
ncbi:MAG: prolipoprotein diacylglyceryl transferase, partial [Bdellovibrionales bacterium]|nr:prolipoprotein diacylglyceryl transferase [Bdellovibrionales bacterium]